MKSSYPLNASKIAGTITASHCSNPGSTFSDLAPRVRRDPLNPSPRQMLVKKVGWISSNAIFLHLICSVQITWELRCAVKSLDKRETNSKRIRNRQGRSSMLTYHSKVKKRAKRIKRAKRTKRAK